MIRLIIVALTLVLFLILSIPVLIVEWIIGKFNPRARDISSLRIIQGVFKLIFWETGSHLTIIGEENIPKGETVLYVGNHRSYFDVVTAYSRCPDLTGFVSKDNLEKIPLLSAWMRRLYCLFLNRSDIRQGLKTILTGVEQMKSGISMCIYPEGTRHSDGKIHRGKVGVGMLALKGNVPVIPVYVAGTFEAFGKKHTFPRIWKTLTTVIGKPITFQDLIDNSALDKKEAYQLATDRIMAKITELQTWFQQGCIGEIP